eukprot:5502628-Amphidinium_carterae.1
MAAALLIQAGAQSSCTYEMCCMTLISGLVTGGTSPRPDGLPESRIATVQCTRVRPWDSKCDGIDYLSATWVSGSSF